MIHPRIDRTMKNVLKIGGLVLIMVASLCLSHVFGMTPTKGLQMAGITPVALPVLNTMAEKEMIKNFGKDNSWMSELRSKNQWVGNDSIKIPTQGAAPSVLINNTTYPINKAVRQDGHVVISLNKFDTTNTIVTADELYALPYDKTSDVQQQHRLTLEETYEAHSLHSLAPSAHSAKTPVLVATGTAVGGRATLTSKDVVALKTALDKLRVPQKGRVLVLCPDHVNDLLNEDRSFHNQYHNAKDGVISQSYYGFKTYESVDTVTYTAENAKVAFGATAGPKVSSICFYNQTACKAIGTVERFARDAKDDPERRENTVGFRMYGIAVAIKDEGVGAIIG